MYLFKVNSGNTRIVCKICLKLTVKTPVTEVILMSLLLALNRIYCSGVSIVDLEQINAGRFKK